MDAAVERDEAGHPVVRLRVLAVPDEQAVLVDLDVLARPLRAPDGLRCVGRHRLGVAQDARERVDVPVLRVGVSGVLGMVSFPERELCLVER